MELLSGIGYIIVIGTVLLCCGGVFLWWLYKKNQYKFSFRLWSLDMKNSRLIKGRIKTDESNKKYQYYAFKENNTRLDINEPTHWEDGKPLRHITYTSTGDYVYLDNLGIDKTELKFQLKPTHKTLYLQMLKDNANKFPLLNKALMFSMGAIILVGLFIMVGFIYTFASNVKQGQQITDLAKVNLEITNAQGSISNSMVTSSNNIYSAVSLLYNGTITRPLEPTALEGVKVGTS